MTPSADAASASPPTLTVATFSSNSSSSNSSTMITSIITTPIPSAESVYLDLSLKIYAFTSSTVTIYSPPTFTPSNDPCIPSTSMLTVIKTLPWSHGPLRHSTSLKPSTLILELLYSPTLTLITFGSASESLTCTPLKIPLQTSLKSITPLTSHSISLNYPQFHDTITLTNTLIHSSKRTVSSSTESQSTIYPFYSVSKTAQSLNFLSTPPTSLLPLEYTLQTQSLKKTTDLLGQGEAPLGAQRRGDVATVSMSFE
ncbi:hypothetical protein TL16_g06158 [Triparma laevis f. inornata]|uniref:Uncharacterized protein n=1 Tax=Triparma laevis f. inornata TaxID=1714386 RepID=A0A9W7ECT0_9STRA|nr:hypothetical protein TL16_g06158 [Triparma laevis f. inornata]